MCYQWAPYAVHVLCCCVGNLCCATLHEVDPLDRLLSVLSMLSVLSVLSMLSVLLVGWVAQF